MVYVEGLSKRYRARSGASLTRSTPARSTTSAAKSLAPSRKSSASSSAGVGKEKQRRKLAQLRDDEVLTTRQKKGACAKAHWDLKHRTTLTLSAGIAQTLTWMREVDKVR